MILSPPLRKPLFRTLLGPLALATLCLALSQSAPAQVFPPHAYQAPPTNRQAQVQSQVQSRAQAVSAPARQAPTPSSSRQQAIYESGVNAMEKGNFAEAFCTWRPLAEAGHIEAEYSLGWMYANGYGLAIDEAQALEWWKKAAAQGHGEAQFAVAMAYVYGEGVPRDRATAVKWLTKAAQNGVEDARTIILDMAGRGIEEAEAVVREHLTGDWTLFGPSATITADRANVRSGPTTDLKILVTLKKGAKVLPLSKRGDWYRIGIIGTDTLGWLYHTLMSKPDKTKTPAK